MRRSDEYSGPVAGLIARHRAASTSKEIDFFGLRLTVPPGVFDPSIAHSSKLLASLLPPASSEVVIDIGTGSGALGLLAASKGAQVIATDISGAAIDAASANALQLGLDHRFTCHKAFGFHDVSPKWHGAVDTIICNPPFIDRKPNDELEAAFMDEHNSLTYSVIRVAPGFLNPHGQLLLAFATFGPLETVATELKLHFREVTRPVWQEFDGEMYAVFRAKSPILA